MALHNKDNNAISVIGKLVLDTELSTGMNVATDGFR